MADRIELSGLVCPARHGVYPEEHTRDENFLVDVVVWFDQRAAAVADDVALTVDYGQLAQIAYDITTGTRRDLIETVAAEIADTIMDQWGIIHAAEVVIHKPHAPLGLPVTDVAVVARRSRKRPSTAGG